MVSLRDLFLGQSLKKNDDQQLKEEKPAEKKSESKWIPGKSYRPQDFIKLIGIDDTVNRRMFTKGEFGQHREQLTKLLEEVAARKGQDQTFNREEAAKIAREYHGKSDTVSRLLAKAIDNALN